MTSSRIADWAAQGGTQIVAEADLGTLVIIEPSWRTSMLPRVRLPKSDLDSRRNYYHFSLEVLPDTEIHLPLGLVARFVERNAEIDAYGSDGRVVAERGTSGELEVLDWYIVGVG